jgi:hypothetical protein
MTSLTKAGAALENFEEKISKLFICTIGWCVGLIVVNKK